MTLLQEPLQSPINTYDDKWTWQAGLTWRPRPSWRTTVSKWVFKIVEIHGDVSFSRPSRIGLLWVRIRKIPGWSWLRFRFSWRGSCPPNVGVIVPIIPIRHLDCSSRRKISTFSFLYVLFADFESIHRSLLCDALHEFFPRISTKNLKIQKSKQNR